MPRRPFALAAAVMALPLLAGCLEDPVQTTAPGNPDEAVARQACIRDVRATTGNPDVSVVSSYFSEAGTEVNLRVGPSGTWRCIGYRDGTTAGIQSTTDEGAL
ncbi:hypothetical protein [Roseivivax isoporae]|uniref:Lipoprotein n=1 Tax=Roseivivax isoporae LMG 25204 TaxID=1449351 RepID=X7F998_9RHOB|nr:hypothetical protein [Roseivivax isoporae]ETX28644.1 hypothetical protein RISW2_05990 [Roseivivax isoporae LMG 25204]